MACGPEILSYIREVSGKFGLEKLMRFNSKVLEAKWDENESKWNLTSKSGPFCMA